MRLASPMQRVRAAAPRRLPCGFERFLEVQRAFVDRAAGDGADDAVALVLRELLDVGDRGQPAGGDDRKLDLARELHRGFDVDAGEHAVAADVGVDDAFDAVVLELAREVDHVVARHLRPAVGRDLAFARVETDPDVAGERRAGVVQESRVLDGGGADDDVADAVVEIALDRVEVADAAAELHRDLLADHAHDLADRQLVARLAGDRAVEVDEVQALRALLEPVLGHRRGVLGEHGGRVHVALLEAHAMAVLDVDCGDDLHGSGMAAERARGCRGVERVEGFTGGRPR